MSEENLPVQEEESSGVQAEELSKTEAMAGIFTAPGDTYEAVSRTEGKNYWIIPVLISIVISLIASTLFMRDEELVSKTMEKQKEKMREQFEKKVKEGAMTQEEMNKTMEGMSSGSILFKIAGYGGAVLGPFLILFILSIIYLVALKILKADFAFTNILNVVGLAMLVSSVGSLVSVIISILVGDVSSLGLGLIFSNAAVGEKIHTLLTKIDVFTIWFYGLIAIGLSKVGKVSVGVTSSIVFALFLIYAVVTSIIF